MGSTNNVKHLETIEDRNAQTKTDRFLSVIFQLVTERNIIIISITEAMIVTAAVTYTEIQFGIITGLSHLQYFLLAFEQVFLFLACSLTPTI